MFASAPPRSGIFHSAPCLQCYIFDVCNVHQNFLLKADRHAVCALPVFCCLSPFSGPWVDSWWWAQCFSAHGGAGVSWRLLSLTRRFQRDSGRKDGSQDPQQGSEKTSSCLQGPNGRTLSALPNSFLHSVPSQLQWPPLELGCLISKVRDELCGHAHSLCVAACHHDFVL